MYDRTNAFRTANTQAAWQMTRRAYIDSLIAAGELFGIDSGLPTKLAKTTAKGVRTAGGKFVPYSKLSHVYEHRCRVEEAIRKGWPVPAEVLADYPDLVQQATSKLGMSSDSTARA